jgi:hypothetical protein
MGIGAAICAAVAVGGSPEPASAVSCGDTVTADTTLHKDLVDCTNNGIEIGADDLTLDLNGHSVTGDGKPFKGCADNESCDAGLLNEGHDGITLRHGVVRRFGAGVVVGDAARNSVLDIRTSRNDVFGFVVAGSSRTVIRNSSGNRNPAPEGDGLGLFGAHHTRITHSAFRRNGLGIHVADSSRTLIRDDAFSGNADFGVLIQANGTRAQGNRCKGNGGACILVETGNRNAILRNHSSGGTAGIAVEDGHRNLIAHNFVRHPQKQGVYLGLRSPLIGGGSNIVRGNRVVSSGSDAFKVNEKDGHSLLRGNVAIGAHDDGFDVESRTARLTGNRALRNGGIGIDAVRGVADGGGNVARHNRGSPQCRRIACGRRR